MNQPQAVQAIIPTPRSPNPQPATRAQLDRARALVIAQLGAAVLVDLDHERRPSAPSTPRSDEQTQDNVGPSSNRLQCA